MTAGSLTSHLMTQHGRVAETRRLWRTPDAGAGPRTFQMNNPAKGGPWSCPVEGCLGRVATRTAMWVHFLHRHVLDTVVILEEGKFGIPPPNNEHAIGSRRPAQKKKKNKKKDLIIQEPPGVSHNGKDRKRTSHTKVTCNAQDRNFTTKETVDVTGLKLPHLTQSR